MKVEPAGFYFFCHMEVGQAHYDVSKSVNICQFEPYFLLLLVRLVCGSRVLKHLVAHTCFETTSTALSIVTQTLFNVNRHHFDTSSSLHKIERAKCKVFVTVKADGTYTHSNHWALKG
jgi:hypothetical protein